MSSQIVIADHNLPDWMKQARRGVDWGVLIVMAFCVLVGWQFIAEDSLPATTDAEALVYRIADTADALREGRLYARWSPHVYDGYGAPIPHFEPPFAAQTGAMMTVLLTDNPIVSLRIMLILALMLAGAMVYVLVMQRTNGIAGVLTACLYVYSPYIGLTVSKLMIDAQTLIALAFLPSVLWAINRLLQRNQPLDLLFIAIFTALLTLTSPVHLIYAVLLGAVLLVVDGRWQQALIVGGALMLGVLIAAFYWLPALIDHGQVTWVAQGISVARQPITLSALFAPLTQPDVGRMFPKPQWAIGYPLLSLTISATLAALWQRQLTPLLYAGLGVGLLGMLVIFLPTQTHLLGAVVLCFALSTSSLGTLTARAPTPMRYLLVTIGALALLGWHLPIWLNYPYLVTIDDVSAQAQQASEDSGHGVATLSDDRMTIAPPRALQNPPTIATPANTENRIQIEDLAEGTHYGQYQVLTTVGGDLIIERTYFEGWRATLDGQFIPLVRDTSGLLRVTLPANANGILIVQLGTTWLRSGAWTLSLLSSAGVIFITWRRQRDLALNYDLPVLLSLNMARLLIALCGLMLALRLSPIGTQWIESLREPRNHTLRDVVITGGVTVAELELLAYRLPQTAITPDLTLYWTLNRPTTDDLRVQVRLIAVDDEQQQFASTINPPGGYSSFIWRGSGFVIDQQTLPMPDKAGEYQVTLQVFRCEDRCDQPLSFIAASRSELGVVYNLGTITVVE